MFDECPVYKEYSIFLNSSPVYFAEKIDAIFKSPHNSPNEVNEVEMEVQILDLKDVYDKKTRRTFQGLEYRLEDSEVTVVLQASDEISSVRAFVQRCPEAAIRTHDTIGRHLHSYSPFSKQNLLLSCLNQE